MTRKDYVALAEALADARPTPTNGNDGRKWIWVQCVDSIAAVLAKDNSRFDRERFIRACQGEK